MAKAELVVLGAGIVGLSCAIHLQRAGLSVTLVDRGEPGCETSFGNAGVLSRGSVVPFSTPNVWKSLHRYAFNLDAGVRLAPAFIPQFTPWLIRFLRECTTSRAIAISEGLNELLRRAVDEHAALTVEAGVGHLLRRDGWVRVFRTERGFRGFRFEQEQLRMLGVRTEILDAGGLAELEPNLRPGFYRGAWYPQTAAVTDPGAVCQAFSALFQAEGGAIRRGTVERIKPTPAGWRVELEADALHADQVVVAMGSWSADILKPVGVDLPLLWERGYHLHFHVTPGNEIQRPVNDVEGGYVIAPMEQGHRVTSGIEFAPRDGPPSPVQFERVLHAARSAVNLGDCLDGEPWLGRRPSMPDSLPVIGAAPGHPKLWLAFGHGHIGFTTGPITGRLITDLVTGRKPVIDPTPFSADRYR